MRIHAFVIWVTLSLASSSIWAEKRVNFGGTNHWLYAYGTADGLNTGGSWYIPALNLRPSVAHYHLNPSLVNSQIAAAAASGQNAYVIFIWNSDIGSCEFTSCNDGVPDGVWGEVIDNSGYAMRPQHRQNLQSIIETALAYGFARIYIRFGYNGSPSSWPSWDEAKYQKAWNFILDARGAAMAAAENFGIEVFRHPHSVFMFDLGAEDGGLAGGQRQAFMQRLWTDYTLNFGVQDTVGFSFAWAPGRFTTQRNLLAATGTLPQHWGFDIYDGMSTALSSIYSEMGILRNQPIHILETYFNDAATSAQLSTALASNEFLNVSFIGQWPVYSGYNHGHFSQGVVDILHNSSQLFFNYEPRLANRKIHISSSNADLLAVRDLDCATSLSWPCSVRLAWGSPPSGRRFGIYVTTAAGTGLVHCVQSAGQGTISWISLHPSYVFDIYEINAGSCGHPSPNAGAIKRATAESTPFGY